MEKLKPCPFCGHPRSRLMHRTEYRENAEGLTALEYEPRICVEGIEYGGEDYEVKMLDFRHVFYRRCNKCGATSSKVKTDWHVRTQDEADDFSIYNSQREKLWGFDPDSDWAAPWREQANDAWNRRAGECGCDALSGISKMMESMALDGGRDGDELVLSRGGCYSIAHRIRKAIGEE